jgi:hypothetical protein
MKRPTSYVWIGLLCATCYALSFAVLVGSASGATPSPDPIRIYDLEYIKRTYFLLADHPLRIQPGSIHIWKDVAPVNPSGVLGGARLDPEAPMDILSNPEFRWTFAALEDGPDFQIIYLWLAEGLPPGFGIPIIQLTVALGPYEMLAASYVDESTGTPIRVGTVTAADYEEADSALGKPANTILVKMIKQRLDQFPSDWNGNFDPTLPWYPTLFYELRNLYNLHQTNIPKDRFWLAIRRIDLGGAADPDYVDGKPLVQVLGLDQAGRPGSPDSLAPDGRIDDQFIDYERGLLFFPDLHPFDPDTTNPIGVCTPGYGGFNCLDNYARNILRIDSSNPASQANPRVYYARNPDVFAEARFYIETFIVPPPPPGGTLHQNAPNPFNPGTTIRFDLNYAGHARIAIYDVQGRLVAEPLDTNLPAGPNEVFWSGNDAQGRRVASGIYFCELETAGHSYSRRMVLAR